MASRRDGSTAVCCAHGEALCAPLEVLEAPGRYFISSMSGQLCIALLPLQSLRVPRAMCLVGARVRRTYRVLHMQNCCARARCFAATTSDYRPRRRHSHLFARLTIHTPRCPCTCVFFGQRSCLQRWHQLGSHGTIVDLPAAKYTRAAPADDERRAPAAQHAWNAGAGGRSIHRTASATPSRQVPHPNRTSALRVQVRAPVHGVPYLVPSCRSTLLLLTYRSQVAPRTAIAVRSIVCSIPCACVHGHIFASPSMSAHGHPGALIVAPCCLCSINSKVQLHSRMWCYPTHMIARALRTILCLGM